MIGSRDILPKVRPRRITPGVHSIVSLGNVCQVLKVTVDFGINTTIVFRRNGIEITRIAPWNKDKITVIYQN